ncbi:hypothetical protein [Sulfurimonas sp.]|uniref:hypothetical protein n=1 Tax=Sulfurimonas sp. TaxID=2022749 RepID=UPI003569C05B
MPRIKAIETFTDGSKNNTYLDVADSATALTLCQVFYGGKVEVFEETVGITTSDPSLSSVSCKLVKVAMINDTLDTSTFFGMYVKPTVSSLDIINGLIGKTIDNVKAERVDIISSTSYTV